MLASPTATPLQPAGLHLSPAQAALPLHLVCLPPSLPPSLPPFPRRYYGLKPDIKVIAPWREWDLNSRTKLIAYAETHGIGVRRWATGLGGRADSGSWLSCDVGSGQWAEAISCSHRNNHARMHARTPQAVVTAAHAEAAPPFCAGAVCLIAAHPPQLIHPTTQVPAGKRNEPPFSMDANLLHISYEG